MSTDILKEFNAFVFRAEEKAKHEAGFKKISVSYQPHGSLTFFFTVKMQMISSFETSVDFQRNTRRYIPQDRTLPL
jgi:hypothetical protein